MQRGATSREESRRPRLGWSDLGGIATVLTLLGFGINYWYRRTDTTASDKAHRAELVVSHAEGNAISAPNSPMELSVGFKNVGLSTASGVSIAGRFEYDHTANGRLPHFDRYEADPGETQIGAGQEIFLPAKSAQGPDQLAMNQMVAGEGDLFFHGRVNYQDIYRHSHWLNYCLHYDPHAATWSLCKIHNNSDNL